MPLDPRLWFTPPPYRRFPDDIAEIYEDDNTPLVEVCELWTWKWDLVQPGRYGAPEPDYDKIAKRLGQEVSDFLTIEDASREVIESALREDEPRSEDATT